MWQFFMKRAMEANIIATRISLDVGFHFTGVCPVLWPLNRREAGDDLVLQTFVVFLGKSCSSQPNKPVKILIIGMQKARRFVTKQGPL